MKGEVIQLYRNRWLGFFFLFIGLLLLLNNLGLLSGNAFLLILGLGFLAIYFLLGGRRRYGNIGLLIPGTILISIWLSTTITQVLELGALDGAVFLFLMGLAFLTVFILHTHSFRDHAHGDRYWPLYPAAGLFLIGGVAYLSQLWERDFTFSRYMNYIWVVVFLGIGLKLVLGKKSDHSNNNELE